jgi:cation diffusion facilitator CzcD-associated flavoprotein CzcO
MKDVIIIGAGLSGLATAYYLKQKALMHCCWKEEGEQAEEYIPLLPRQMILR